MYTLQCAWGQDTQSSASKYLLILWPTLNRIEVEIHFGIILPEGTLITVIIPNLTVVREENHVIIIRNRNTWKYLEYVTQHYPLCFLIARELGLQCKTATLVSLDCHYCHILLSTTFIHILMVLEIECQTCSALLAL